jgi:tRNA dimethylallyltransferase
LSTASKTNPNTTCPAVVLLFGPTAVGKTQLLADLFCGTGEIINADSMQVYRGMDIGTAKPDAQTRKQLPHHLLDVRNPDEQFNAGDFVAEADTLVRQIHARGLIPVISGGTAFYFRNFMYGLPNTPASDAAVRKAVRLEIDRSGLAAAYELLQDLDPVAAERIAKQDRYRIERALEVIRTTGRRFSDYAASTTLRSEFRMLLIGLDRPRDELYARINERVELMFSHGLSDEVTELVSAGYGASDPGMQGIGYRQFQEMASTGCCTLGDVRDAIARDSRRYAKRQLTFFRRFAETQWFHPDELERIRGAIDGFLLDGTTIT